jgi:hypothetical protein
VFIIAMSRLARTSACRPIIMNLADGPTLDGAKELQTFETWQPGHCSPLTLIFTHSLIPLQRTAILIEYEITIAQASR